MTRVNGPSTGQNECHDTNPELLLLLAVMNSSRAKCVRSSSTRGPGVSRFCISCWAEFEGACVEVSFLLSLWRVAGGSSQRGQKVGIEKKKRINIEHRGSCPVAFSASEVLTRFISLYKTIRWHVVLSKCMIGVCKVTFCINFVHKLYIDSVQIGLVSS